MSRDSIRQFLADSPALGLVVLGVTMAALLVIMATDGWPMRAYRRTTIATITALTTGSLLFIGMRFLLLPQ